MVVGTHADQADQHDHRWLEGLQRDLHAGLFPNLSIEGWHSVDVTVDAKRPTEKGMKQLLEQLQTMAAAKLQTLPRIPRVIDELRQALVA